jgi:hypothetical protein
MDMKKEADEIGLLFDSIYRPATIGPINYSNY